MERRKTFRGSPYFCDPRGRAALPYRSGIRSPAGVDGTGRTDIWGPPGTWEILPPPRRDPGRGDRVNNSGPRRRTRPAGSEEDEWTRRYRPTKETKCGGTGGRES